MTDARPLLATILAAVSLLKKAAIVSTPLRFAIAAMVKRATATHSGLLGMRSWTVPRMPFSAATPAGHPCDAGGTAQENQCFSAVTDTLSCEPFITDPSNKMVAWFCAHSVGQGLPGAACTDGSTCRTGFCGSNGTCFRACGAGAPCPVPPNGTVPYRCAGVKILVEGVEVQATSCIP